MCPTSDQEDDRCPNDDRLKLLMTAMVISTEGDHIYTYGSYNDPIHLALAIQGDTLTWCVPQHGLEGMELSLHLSWDEWYTSVRCYTRSGLQVPQVRQQVEIPADDTDGAG